MERTMEVLSNWWPWRGNGEEATRGESSEQQITRVMQPYEHLVVRLQRLLIWDNPALSTLFLVAVNFLFWLVVNLELRFFSLVSVTLLFVFVHRVWTQHIWPEIQVPPKETPDTEGWTPVHPGVLSVPEISQHFDRMRSALLTVYQSSKTMRQQQPGKFCAVFSGAMLLLLLIGKSVSGTVLVYFTMMFCILLPGIWIHLLPADTMTKLQNAKNTLIDFKTNLMSEDQENLIPDFTIEEVSAVMNLNGTDIAEEEEIKQLLPVDELSQIENDETMQSLTPSFSYMPSHDEDSMDCLDLTRNQDKEDTESQVSATDSRSRITFRSRHFNGDDSSDDDSFSKGLAFSDTTPTSSNQGPMSLLPSSIAGPLEDMLTRAAVENVTRGLVEAMTSVASSVVSSSVPASAPSVPEEEDSDNEMDDFEVIDQEELLKLS